jgi:hypothetical protein
MEHYKFNFDRFSNLGAINMAQKVCSLPGMGVLDSIYNSSTLKALNIVGKASCLSPVITAANGTGFHKVGLNSVGWGSTWDNAATNGMLGIPVNSSAFSVANKIGSGMDNHSSNGILSALSTANGAGLHKVGLNSVSNGMLEVTVNSSAFSVANKIGSGMDNHSSNGILPALSTANGAGLHKVGLNSVCLGSTWDNAATNGMLEVTVNSSAFSVANKIGSGMDNHSSNGILPALSTANGAGLHKVGLNSVCLGSTWDNAATNGMLEVTVNSSAFSVANKIGSGMDNHSSNGILSALSTANGAGFHKVGLNSVGWGSTWDNAATNGMLGIPINFSAFSVASKIGFDCITSIKTGLEVLQGIGVNNYDPSNLYQKHDLETIRSDNFSFYSKRGYSKAEAENTACKMLSKLKISPEHVGFEYKQTPHKTEVNIYIITGNINGDFIHIGNNITIT